MAEEIYRPWLWKVPEGGVLGKHVKIKDGYAKASGRGLYTRDIYRPGMLYAKFIRSPYTHAKIKSVDTTEAKALPGVWDVMTYDDPDMKVNWFNYKFFSSMVVGESDAEMKIYQSRNRCQRSDCRCLYPDLTLPTGTDSRWELSWWPKAKRNATRP